MSFRFSSSDAGQSKWAISQSPKHQLTADEIVHIAHAPVIRLRSGLELTVDERFTRQFLYRIDRQNWHSLRVK